MPVPPEAGFELHLSDEVATITLNRPERLNAQTPHTWDALVAVARELPGTVRIVVLRGAGRSFSAGLDRQMFTAEGVPGAPGILTLANAAAHESAAQIGAWQWAFDWQSRPGVVSIAAVQGHAIGAGFQLALGADIRLVADDVQFTMKEPALGIVPDLGGTKRLVDLVGYSAALEICLTGRAVGADEALRLGLATRAVAPDDLDDAVDQLVTALLAVNRDAATETKALLLAASRRTQDEQQAAEREAQHRRLRALVGLDAEA